MALNIINASMLSKMFLVGAKNLEQKKEWINDLNVFPVPDGDTGTNMTLTIMSAAKEVVALGENPDMNSVCKAISSGSLRGARGNSGVILSQLLRGFTKVISEHEELDTIILAEALERGVETAYKAVMKPKEGTILTVAKGAAWKANDLVSEGITDMEVFMSSVIEHTNVVLSQTPDLLPVLKQAGVVDSGGQGLVEVLQGAFDAYMGKEISIDISSSTNATKVKYDAQASEDIKFGYCTEFIILLENEFSIKNEMDFKAYLENIGDSIVCVADDDIVKIHVHTNDPGLAIQKALTYGALSNLKIDNMRLEHQEKLFEEAEKNRINNANGSSPMIDVDFEEMEEKEVGFISVSIGDGMSEVFKGLGVDYLIQGGQTMNPSTADILDAVDCVNAKTIYIFPNNKNIILAANQAADLVINKELIVIPTTTIPQGITAIINFDPTTSTKENQIVMTNELKSVNTGQVTYAVRDTTIDHKEIKQGDYMGIGDSGILSVGKDIRQVTLKLADEITTDTTELISVYYGLDISDEDALSLSQELEAKFPTCDIVLQSGGQPIYYYILSAE